MKSIYVFSLSPVNDPSSESSDNTATSESSSEEETTEVKPEPENQENDDNNELPKWNLRSFLPGPITGGPKSPNEVPILSETAAGQTVNNINNKNNIEHDEDEGKDIHRSPISDNYRNENSNSPMTENKFVASQERESITMMAPPSKTKSPPDIESAFAFIRNLQQIQPIQPLSSLSDCDDKAEDSKSAGHDRHRKKPRSRKRSRPVENANNDSSSDEDDSKFSECRRRSVSTEEKIRRGRTNKKASNVTVSLPPPAAANITSQPYEATNTSSDTNSNNGTKKSVNQKSPKKEGRIRKASSKRRPSIPQIVKSKETISTSDVSSDDDDENDQHSRKSVRSSHSVQSVTQVKPKGSITNHRHEPGRPSKSPAKKSSKIKQPESAKKPASDPSASSSSSPSSSSDSEDDCKPKPSTASPVRNNEPARRHSSSSSHHSGTEDSSRSSTENIKNKKIEKIVSDKNTVLLKLFNSTKANEGAKGGKGKGGAKGKGGQVVVIMPDDAQNQSKLFDSMESSNSPSNNSAKNVQSANTKYLPPSSAVSSVIVRIDLARIDLSRLHIPPEKPKNIRTKSSAVPVVESQRPNKRRRSSQDDDNDKSRRREKSNKNFDQMNATSSSSSDHQIENATSRVSFPASYTNNDRLNNNVDHKSSNVKSFCHSPSSMDTKLTKIKRESNAFKNEFRTHSASPMKEGKSGNDFKNKIKQENVKEELDGVQDFRKRTQSMTENNVFKDKKRKKVTENAVAERLQIPPTNHDRLTTVLANGDAVNPKQEIVKKVFVSYFERNNDDVEQSETRFVRCHQN